MRTMLSPISRSRRNATAADPVPLAVQVNITGRCPCRCWHCEKAVDRSGSDLAASVLADCQAAAARWRCPVLYSGGEPLAHPRWPGILRDGLALGLRQKLVTSGAGFERLRPGEAELLATSLDELLVSVDAADGATHDRLRGRPGLHAAILDWLRQAPRPPRVWLVHVPDPCLDRVGAMLELAAAHGVGLIVQPYSFVSNFPHLEPLVAKDAARNALPSLAATAAARARDLASVAQRARVPSNLGEVALFLAAYYESAAGGPWYGHRLAGGFGCSVPWQQLTVDELGCVQPCALLRGEPVPVGLDLAEAWRRQALAYRERMAHGKVWPECHGCTCHFGANLRHSALARPWHNRALVGRVLRKRLLAAGWTGRRRRRRP